MRDDDRRCWIGSIEAAASLNRHFLPVWGLAILHLALGIAPREFPLALIGVANRDVDNAELLHAACRLAAADQAYRSPAVPVGHKLWTVAPVKCSCPQGYDSIIRKNSSHLTRPPRPAIPFVFTCVTLDQDVLRKTLESRCWP